MRARRDVVATANDGFGGAPPKTRAVEAHHANRGGGRYGGAGYPETGGYGRSVCLQPAIVHQPQLTVFQMGEAALQAAPEISRLTRAMPNKYYLLANLAPFDLENRNKIFVAADEPHGQIEGTDGQSDLSLTLTISLGCQRRIGGPQVLVPRQTITGIPPTS